MPPSPFWSSDQAGARAALAAVESWRHDLSAWLTGEERDDGISPGLAAVLSELLGAASTEAYRRYPYRLARFPALDAADLDPCAAMRSVLLWRAGIVDFLADVWDTMGEADFGIDECRRVASLLSPIGSETSCPLCLEPSSAESSARHYAACAVQASWRAASS